MNIGKTISQLSSNALSATERVRLIRMGYTYEEIFGLNHDDYDRIAKEHAQVNSAYRKRNGMVNLYQAPVSPKQISYLESLGYEFTEQQRESYKDGQARDLITIIQFAQENEAFLTDFAVWLKDSTSNGQVKFTRHDVDLVKRDLAAMAIAKEQQLAAPPTVEDENDEVAEHEEWKRNRNTVATPPRPSGFQTSTWRT